MTAAALYEDRKTFNGLINYEESSTKRKQDYLKIWTAVVRFLAVTDFFFVTPHPDCQSSCDSSPGLKPAEARRG
jgi:hypothetical protein